MCYNYSQTTKNLFKYLFNNNNKYCSQYKQKGSAAVVFKNTLID